MCDFILSLVKRAGFPLFLPLMPSKALAKKAVCKTTPRIITQSTGGSSQEVADLVREDCCKLAGSLLIIAYLS